MARNFVKREAQLIDCEIRSGEGQAEGNGRRMTGYAAVFDTDTHIRSWEGDFMERISKGAFKKTIREQTPMMQWNHGRDSRVGQTPIGVYDTLKEDGRGLYVEGDLFDNPVVEPIRQAIEAGAVSGMSFTFSVVRDEWRDSKGKLIKPDELGDLLYNSGDRGPIRRNIKELRASEMGPVGSPAYKTTSVGVRSTESRSLEEATEEDRESILNDYRRSMYVEQREEDNEQEELARWLEAENTWRWLEAEATYRWLQAEQEHARLQSNADQRDDAVKPQERKHTSRLMDRSPTDAVRKHTSRRDSQDHKPSQTKEKSMKTLEELRARLAEVAVRLDDISEEFRDSDLPEKEDKEWDSLSAEETDIRSKIEKIEARAARAVDAEAKGTSFREKAPTVHTKPENIYDLDAIRSASNSPEDFQRRVADNARRAVEEVRLPSTAGDKEKSQERMERLLMEADDQFGTLSKRFLVTGSETYERAFSKMARANMSRSVLDREEERAIVLGVDASGGYNVPFQLDPSITLTSPRYVNPIREKARHVQIVGKEWQANFTGGGVVYRGSEASTALDGSPTFSQVPVRTNEVKGFFPFSYAAEASWPQLRAELTTVLADAKDQEEANAFLLGNGVDPAAGGLIGTLPGTKSVAAGSGLTVSQADIFKLIEALPVRYLQNAEFLGNKGTFNKIRQLDTAGGSAFWQNFNGTTPTSLAGYAVNEITLMADYKTNANKFLLFGDIHSAFVIVDRIGMSVQEIPVLFDSANSNRPTSQGALFAVWMNNSKIINSDAVRVLTATT